MRNKKKNIIIYLIIFLALLIIELVPMLLLDINKHRLSGIPHSFKGEVWFSVIAAIFAAVPGTFCGLLALIQTQRLHRMENWYRRPILIMREAKMGLLLCANPDVSYSRYTAQERDYINEVKGKFRSDCEHEGILSLKLQFELQSEPVIRSIEIESVEFAFPDSGEGGTYLLNIDETSANIKEKGGERYAFHSCYENGHVCYTVLSDLYAGQQLMSINFWKAVSGFLDYANEAKPKYQRMDTKVHLRVYHEYACGEYDVFLLQIHWKASTKNTRKEIYMEQVSRESVCSYINRDDVGIVLHEKRIGRQKKKTSDKIDEK